MMRGLIWPLKTIALAALAAAGLLMASGFKAADPPNASYTIDATQGRANEGEDPYGGAGGFLDAGY